jgi:1,4-alpha-glucan branching enzyme
MHAGLRRLVADLNRLYRAHPALHQFDCDPRGFEWIDARDAEQSVLVYMRRGDGDSHPVAVVCNLSPVVRSDYRIGVPVRGAWREVLNSDAVIYGGSGVGSGGSVNAEDVTWHGRPASLRLTLPPLGVVVLTPSE